MVLVLVAIGNESDGLINVDPGAYIALAGAIAAPGRLAAAAVAAAERT